MLFKEKLTRANAKRVVRDIGLGLVGTAILASATDHAVDVYGTIPVDMNIGGHNIHLSGGLVLGSEDAAGNRPEGNGHDFTVSPFDLFQISVSVGGEDIGRGIDFPGEPSSGESLSFVAPVESVVVFSAKNVV